MNETLNIVKKSIEEVEKDTGFKLSYDFKYLLYLTLKKNILGMQHD